MVDEQAAADGGAGVDLDAGEEAAEMGNDAAEQAPAALPGGMSKAIEQQRLESGIGEHDLNARARRRVAGHHRVDIVNKMLENHETHHGNIRAAATGWTRKWAGSYRSI